MPYSSDAQRRWAHTVSGEKALGGPAKVHEWDEASKGKNLPEHTPKKKKKQRRMGGRLWVQQNEE